MLLYAESAFTFMGHNYSRKGDTVGAVLPTYMQLIVKHESSDVAIFVWTDDNRQTPSACTEYTTPLTGFFTFLALCARAHALCVTCT